MIVLKILLIILLVILGLVVLLLVLPVSADVSFIDKKLEYSVKYAYITILDSNKGGILGWINKRKQKKKKKKTKAADTAEGTLTHESSQTSEEVSKVQEDTKSEAAETAPEEKPKEEQPAADKTSETDTDKTSEAEDSSPDDDEKEEKKKGGSLGEKVEKLLNIWSCAKNPAAKIFRGIHLEDIYIDFIISDTDAYKCAVNYGRISGALYNLLAQMSRLFTVRFKTVDVRCGFAIEKSQWDGSLRVRLCLGTFVLSGIWFIGAYVFRVFIPDKIAKSRSKKTAAEQK